jgi:hypothetical protein
MLYHGQAKFCRHLPRLILPDYWYSSHSRNTVDLFILNEEKSGGPKTVPTFFFDGATSIRKK